MKLNFRKKNKKIQNIHLLDNADENEVRTRTGYVRRRRNPARLLLIRLSIVVAVLLVLFLLWKNWEKIAPESVLDWAQVQFGNVELGDGYPYEVAGNSVLGMGQVDTYLTVLTDDALTFLNGDATKLVQRPNTLTEPTLKIAGNYVLVTELGGSRFHLETRRETVYQMTLPNRRIYASDVAKNGVVAVVTDPDSQNYICGLQVYDARKHQLFQYKSSKYHIVNISLSPDGRSLSAVGTTAENGKLKSVVLVFDLDKDTPAEYVGYDQLLYGVEYFDNTILVVGDEEYWTITVNDGTVNKTPYNGMEVIGYAASQTTAGLVVRQSGSAASGEVWLFDHTGKRFATHAFNGTYRSAACQDSSFVILTDQTVYVWDKDSKTVDAPSDSLMVCEYNDTVMILTLNDLQQVK